MDTQDNQIYLFTYSPSGTTKNYDFNYAEHYKCFFSLWHHCMLTYEINPELNQNGNLHYHGYFSIKDRFKWYKKVLPKMKYNGFIKIDLVKNDFNKAIEYARKDRTLMLKLIQQRPLPITHNDFKFLENKEKNKTIIDYLT